LFKVVLFEPDKHIAVGLSTALVTHGLEVIEYQVDIPGLADCLLLVRAAQLDKLPYALQQLPKVILGQPKGPCQALAILNEQVPLPALAMELRELYARLRQ